MADSPGVSTSDRWAHNSRKMVSEQAGLCIGFFIFVVWCIVVVVILCLTSFSLSLGVVRDAWWRVFVEQRMDCVGFDSSIITSPKVTEGNPTPLPIC